MSINLTNSDCALHVYTCSVVYSTYTSSNSVCYKMASLFRPIAEVTRRESHGTSVVCHRTSCVVCVFCWLRGRGSAAGRLWAVARRDPLPSRRELCRRGEMGNLATLLVKFGAASLLACLLADHSLAHDETLGKSPDVLTFPMLAVRHGASHVASSHACNTLIEVQ